MLTHKTAKKQQTWPSLASVDSIASTSFFGDNNNPKKVVAMACAKELDVQSDDDENGVDEELLEKKVPIYKNNFGDALANALNSVNASDVKGKSGKKNKKAKKTVLFASGMFNGI